MQLPSTDILIIHPPLVSPALAPLLPAQSVARESGSGGWEIWDANLTFVRNFLLAPENLAEMWQRLEWGRRTLPTAEGDMRLRRLMDALGDPGRRSDRFESAAQDLALFRSESFYRPERLAAASGRLADLAALIRLSWLPASTGDVPAVSTWPANERIDGTLAEDLDRFFDRELPGCLSARTVRKILLVAGSPLQLAVARHLAERMKHRLPSMRMAILDGSDDGATAGCTRNGEWPDFSGLQLHRYFSPEPVLNVPADVLDGPDAKRQLIRWLQRHGGAAACVVGGDVRLTDTALDFGHTTDPNRFTPTLGYCCREDRDVLGDARPMTVGAGLHLICVNLPSTITAPHERRLRQLSRKGVWVQLTTGEDPADRRKAQRLLSTSGVVAGSQIPGAIPWPLNLADAYSATAAARYGRTQPLPGRPLSAWLTDPVHLLLYLRRYGPQTLARWQADEANATVARLGASLAFYYQPPESVPSWIFEEICRMVEAGGTVSMTHVRRNLRHAFLIAYALEGEIVAGNSSLKHPRPEYIAAVSERTGFDLSGCLERGYTSVRPEYRGLGIGTRLLGGLTRRTGGRRLFSIIAEDNAATQAIARRNRTRRLVTFFSEKAGKSVGLWMPEEQLP